MPVVVVKSRFGRLSGLGGWLVDTFTCRTLPRLDAVSIRLARSQSSKLDVRLKRISHLFVWPVFAEIRLGRSQREKTHLRVQINACTVTSVGEYGPWRGASGWALVRVQAWSYPSVTRKLLYSLPPSQTDACCEPVG